MRPTTTGLYSHFGLVSLLIAGLLVPLGAQQPPVFRSGVDLVTVDVTVLDGSGRPVEGIGADRFDVRVDDLPRRVVWAEYVRHHTKPLASADSSLHFDTNEGMNPGRLVLVAVDQAHIRRIEGRSALRAAASFIDALEPTDRVAGAPLTHGGAIQFTSDHASVKTYLQTLTGTAVPIPAHFNIGLSEALAISDGSRTRLDQAVLRECGTKLSRLENPGRIAEAEGMRDPCPVQIEQESRAIAQQSRFDARSSVESLGRLITRLAEIDGPKTLVLVSEGLVAEPQLVDLSALGAVALAARVSIYVLQLEAPVFEASQSTVSPTLFTDVQVRADGLARLAGSARGALFRLVGADPYPFRRILTELGGYYLVAFEPASSDRDGRIHRIEVSARVPEATIRARPSFRIAEARPEPGTVNAQLERLLRNPRLAAELPVRLAAYTLRQPNREGLKVLVVLETVVATAGQDVTVGFVLVNDRGLVVASGAGSTDTGRYTFPVDVGPGKYVLKAAGVEAGGRQGSVERRFDATLGGSGDIRVSDFILAQPSDALIPSVVRVSSDRLVGYLELYAPATWSPEAGSVTIGVTTSDDSAPLLSVPAEFSGAGSGRWVVRGVLPLSDLPPGRYLATARLAIAGLSAEPLIRPFVVTER
jgi:VWFA-related protein